MCPVQSQSNFRLRGGGDSANADDEDSDDEPLDVWAMRQRENNSFSSSHDLVGPLDNGAGLSLNATSLPIPTPADVPTPAHATVDMISVERALNFTSYGLTFPYTHAQLIELERLLRRVNCFEGLADSPLNFGPLEFEHIQTEIWLFCFDHDNLHQHAGAHKAFRMTKAEFKDKWSGFIESIHRGAHNLTFGGTKDRVSHSSLLISKYVLARLTLDFESPDTRCSHDTVGLSSSRRTR